MIAQVVFDLPLEGPFDYLIPENLASQVAVGSQVKVSFGPKRQTGFVVGLLATSTVAKVKPIQAVVDTPVNPLDLDFARQFSAYYGCSLGEALATLVRNRKDRPASTRRDRSPSWSLHRCLPQDYGGQIKQIMAQYPLESRFLVLVPDAFKAEWLRQALPSVRIGMRSSVFASDGRFDCVVMVDDEDASYKQEQTPMYDTRQVLQTRSAIYGFDVAFVGLSPSVEIIALVREGKISTHPQTPAALAGAKIIDLSNYKFVPDLLSPPVRDALEENLKAGQKSLLVFNRKGSYRVTRCIDCGEILKCRRCDSSLYFSRSEGRFLCRHCTYTLPGETDCPKCRKPSWRSYGIGIEQLQSELKKIFPHARIAGFERKERRKLSPAMDHSAEFDMLISTQAVLRFQGKLNVKTAAFVDFDAELNRLDLHSAFNAFRLAVHMGTMARDPLLLQTRTSGHYVLKSLAGAGPEWFYDEELKLRKEFGFSPFGHWIKIAFRGKSEKTVQQQAEDIYNSLNRSAGVHTLTPPLADVVAHKRGQFRWNVMVHATDVPKAIAWIKSHMGQIKRSGRMIVTLNVDP